MLTIAPDTLAALSADKMARFVARTVAFLHGRGLAPDTPPERLGAWVRERCRAFDAVGIESEQGLVLLLALELAHRRDLLADPQAGAILAGHDGEERKLAAVRALAAPADAVPAR